VPAKGRTFFSTIRAFGLGAVFRNVLEIYLRAIQ